MLLGNRALVSVYANEFLLVFSTSFVLSTTVGYGILDRRAGLGWVAFSVLGVFCFFFLGLSDVSLVLLSWVRVSAFFKTG